MPTLFSRDGNIQIAGGHFDAIFVGGIAVAAAFVLVIIISFIVTLLRRRAARRREDNRGTAFLSVRGLVNEPKPESHISQTSDITVTQHIPTTSEKSTVFQHHLDSGNVPRPFTPLSSLQVPSINFRDSYSRSSLSLPRFASARSSFQHSFVSSTASVGDASSFISNLTLGHPDDRKIRQLFNSILPDELLIGLDEKLTILQSCDDGWCIVSRESAFAIPKPSLFTNPEADSITSGLELGAIPAWCFLKPVKGLRAERPPRVSSLGVTVNIGFAFSDDDLEPPRQQLWAWSNN